MNTFHITKRIGNKKNMAKEVVKLNGNAYDAVTGVQLHDAAPPAVATSPNRPLNHTQAHQPQASRTLMRKAVKKPTQGLKRQLKVQSSLSHSSSVAITVKHSASQVNQHHLAKAKQIERSQKISRFHVSKDIPITYRAVPVQQAPEEKPGNTPPVVPPPVPTNKPTDIFEQAIEQASHFVDVTARKKHYKQKARRHALSMSAGIVAILLIAGFSAYQNSPGIQLKVAGMRAGVSTATPNFAAAGFSYNGTSTEQSRVIIGLKDGNKEYQLSQQATNWSSQEMIDHISSVDESGHANYATYSTDGYTVYKFGTNQATWIKDGIWYQVNGLENLSDKQIQALVRNT